MFHFKGDNLKFVMRISIPGKMVFILEWSPGLCQSGVLLPNVWCWYYRAVSTVFMVDQQCHWGKHTTVTQPEWLLLLCYKQQTAHISYCKVVFSWRVLLSIFMRVVLKFICSTLLICLKFESSVFGTHIEKDIYFLLWIFHLVTPCME